MNKDDEDFCDGTSLEYPHRWFFIGNIGLFDSDFQRTTSAGLYQCRGCKRVKLGERKDESKNTAGE